MIHANSKSPGQHKQPDHDLCLPIDSTIYVNSIADTEGPNWIYQHSLAWAFFVCI